MAAIAQVEEHGRPFDCDTVAAGDGTLILTAVEPNLKVARYEVVFD